MICVSNTVYYYIMVDRMLCVSTSFIKSKLLQTLLKVLFWLHSIPTYHCE